MKPEDQLMDALLKEQARKREADEALLAGIDAALDGEPKKESSKWKRAMPLSIAALVALTAAGVLTMQTNFSVKKAKKTGLAVNEGSEIQAMTIEEKARPFSAAASSDEMALSPVEEGKVSLMDVAEREAAARGTKVLPEALIEGTPSPIRLPGAPSASSARVIAANTSAPAEIPVPAGSPSTPFAAFGTEDDFGDGWASGDGGGGGGGNSFFGSDAAVKPQVGGGSDASLAKRKLDRTALLPEPRGRIVVRPDAGRDNYGPLVDQPWKSPWDDAMSTFSIDVDTASYTNLRRMIREGRSIQPDAVRIEECINYFDYNYPEPEGDSPFRVQSVLATCPWKTDHLLARVSIKGREVANNARPASNLVFLIDVSGSMQSPDKLPMLKRAMKLLIDELDERDRVGMVVYAGTEGVVLPPTRLDQEGKSKATAALAKLEAGGSTNGGAGLKRAYQMALENMQAEGVNRVILASDGDFNVGTTGQGELVALVKERAAKGVSLSVLGFGSGNLNDAMMEAVTNDGNGNYFYVDGDREAKRVFLDKLSGTLVTIAKDVKIQVEFNPGKVKAYRLIGYANRVLRNQDFNNDKVDAGDIGAGHTVTAFYEIVPVGVDAPGVGEVDELRYQRPEGRKELVESDDWFTLKLRYKHPEGEKSQLIETPVKGDALAWEEAGNDFRMASAAALFGMKLRKMDEVDEVSWDRVIEIAKPTLAEDPQEQRAEFIEMLKTLK
ncbi:vWA domain-containing protein [Haloferula sp.]|uniref:vWA domain-containing protein n=1 Tax=Haloferula sp. TaxID=2497595 RepID=UPI003C723573